MPGLGTLTIDLAADVANLRKDFEKANRTVLSSMNGLQRSARNTRRAIAGLFGGLSFGLLTREIINITDEMKRYEGQLRLVTSGQEDLERTTAAVFDIAQSTRSEFGATAQFYARLARSTQELGLSQRELLTLTEATNQAIQISGATTAEATGGIIQFAQGLASGALRGDELRSVLENLPRLAQALAQGMGVTVGQLRELGKEGQLTADVVSKALLSQAQAIGAEYEKLPKQVGQQFTLLSNDINRAIGEVDTSDLIGSFEELRAIIADPSVRDGIAGIAKAIVDVVAVGVRELGKLGNAFKFAVNPTKRQDQGKLLVRQIALQQRILELEKAIAQQRDNGGIIDPGLTLSLENAQKKIAAVNVQLDILDDHFRTAPNTPAPLESPGAPPPVTLPAVNAEDEKAAKRRAAAIKGVIDSLQFEIEQLSRSNEQQELYNELRAAGVAVDSAAGQTIAGLVSERQKMIGLNEAELEAQEALKKAKEKRLADEQALREAEQSAIENVQRQILLFGDLNETETAVIETTMGMWREFSDGAKQALIANAQVLDGLNEQRAAQEEAAKAAEDAAQRVADVGRDLGLTFSSAFEDAIAEGAKFSDILKGIEQDILRIATRRLITEPIGDALSSAFSGSGILASLTGKRARGGPVSAGGAYLVGERGPEMFVPPSSGQIVPNNALTGSGTVVNVHVSGVTDADSFRRSAQQIQAQMISAADLARMRNK